MSIEEAAAAAVALWGGRTVAGVDLPTVMMAIAGAESGWHNESPGDPGTSRYACRGYTSWGQWQIHMSAHYDMLPALAGSQSPCDWATWLSTPANCALAADRVIGNGARDLPASALRPWTTWWSPDGDPGNDAGDGNGNYQRYLAQARTAVAQIAPGPVGGAGATVQGTRVALPLTIVFVALFTVAAIAAGVAEMEGKL
jgi:hypothetical protein